MPSFQKNRQYLKFCAYGFLKNLRFFDAFLLLFFIETGISYSQIGMLYAAREIVINVFEIPSGILADTYGRKNSLLAAFTAYVISFIVFYFSMKFSWLLVAMTLYGVGEAFRSGTHKGMIMDYLKLNQWSEHKVEYYGHTRSWSQKGSAISSLVAGVLVLYSGDYRMIYLFAIVPYLLNFINIATYPDEINFSINDKKKRKTHSLKENLKNFLIALRDRNVFRVINSAALHTSFLKAIKDYIQLVMVQIAILLPILLTFDDKRKTGLVVGVLYFIIYFFNSEASKRASKVLKLGISNISRQTLFLGLVAGILCGIFIQLNWWIIALILFIIIYIVENLRKPIMTGMLVDNVPNEILTSVLSAQSFYQTILTSLIAISLGILADSFGIGISLLSVSGFLVLFLILMGKKKSET